MHLADDFRLLSVDDMPAQDLLTPLAAASGARRAHGWGIVIAIVVTLTIGARLGLPEFRMKRVKKGHVQQS